MIRKILVYPDLDLRRKAQPVVEITPAIRALVDDMAETMYEAKAVGLAATQIGDSSGPGLLPPRIFVVDTDDGAGLRVCINPVLARTSKERVVWREGCLSFPGLAESISRPAKVVLCALDREGRSTTLVAEGLLAVALQHELDHLDGMLMTDRMGSLQRQLAIRQAFKE